MYGINVINQGKAGITAAYGVYIQAVSGASSTNIGLYNGGTTQFVGVMALGGANPNATILLSVSNAPGVISGANQYGISLGNVCSSSACTGTFDGIYTGLSTQAASYTTTQANNLHIGGFALGSGSVITTAAGIRIESCNAAGATTIYGLYVNNPAGGGTMYPIYASNTAYLSTAGAWTNAPSWRAGKVAITEVDGQQTGQWFDWLTERHQPVRYRHPLVLDADGAPVGPFTEERAYDHFGFLLDDVPEDVRQAICYDESGALSTKDVEGFLLAMLKVSGQRIKTLEARLEALESKA